MPADFPAGSPPLLLADCSECAVRGPACADCVVSALLGPPPAAAFDRSEKRALAALAESGLLPPLRLVVGGAEG